MKLQFTFIKNIPAVVDDDGVETSPNKYLYEYLGTSNVDIENCDLKLDKELFTDDDLILLSDGAEMVYKNEGYTVRDGSGNTKNKLTKKYTEILEIEKEIRLLGGVETTSAYLSEANETKLAELRATKLELETELADDSIGVEQSTIDDILEGVYG